MDTQQSLNSLLSPPIHKADSKLQVTNYRLIPLLPVFSKIFDRSSCKTTSYLTINSVSSPLKQQTWSYLLYMPLESKDIACSVFLDFAEAFDTINHNILISKLENYGIRGIALNWFNSYLGDRTQVVKCLL